ncbi:MAG: hypothetical protein AB7O52_16005 [Planctomycetota bacterium]
MLRVPTGRRSVLVDVALGLASHFLGQSFRVGRVPEMQGFRHRGMRALPRVALRGQVEALWAEPAPEKWGRETAMPPK